MSNPLPNSPPSRGRWVAILIGVLYLVLIVVLDSRGPLQPPPPEALSDAPAGAAGSAAWPGVVPPPA